MSVNPVVAIPVERLLSVLVGALFIVIGRALPRAPARWGFAMRTPWTLSSERVRRRTHHFAGQSFVIAGALMVGAGALLPRDLVIAMMITAIIASVVGPAAYSFLTWKREPRG